MPSPWPALTSPARRCCVVSWACCAGDPGSFRRAGVAGDRRHRSASRHERPGTAGTAGAGARSACRRSPCLPRQTRRVGEDPLARRARHIAVCRAAEARPFCLAVAGGRRDGKARHDIASVDYAFAKSINSVNSKCCSAPISNGSPDSPCAHPFQAQQDTIIGATVGGFLPPI